MPPIADCVLAVLGVVLAFAIFLGGAVLGTPFGPLDLATVDRWAVFFGLALLVNARRASQVRNAIWPVQGPRYALGVLVVTTALLALAQYLRHFSGHTQWADVSLVHQTLFFPTSNPIFGCDLCLNGTYLAEHLSWTFFLLLPVTAALKSDFFVLALGTGAIFVGTWLLIKHGPLREAPRAALVFVLILICERAFRNAMVWDFREDHLAYLLAALIAVAIHHGRYWLMFVPVSLYLLTKEHFGLATLFLAPVILLDRELPGTRQQKVLASAALVVLSLAVIAINFTYVIPWAAGDMSTSNNIAVRYAEYGISPSEVITTIVFTPTAWVEVFRDVFRRDSVRYVVFLLVPFGLMARRHAAWLLPAVPFIVINVSSVAWTQRTLEHHYELAFLPFMAYGLARGLTDQARGPDAISSAPKAVLIALLLALTVSGRWPAWSIREHWPTLEERSARQELHALLDDLPEETTVASDFRTLARLTRFRRVRSITFPSTAPDTWTWQELSDLNATDITGLAGHNALNADVWIINRQDPLQGKLVTPLGETFGPYRLTAEGRYYLLLTRAKT